MDLKEFLLNDTDINTASIARKLFPNNKSAETYLNRKLKETDDRKLTESDIKEIKDILQKLIERIQSID